MFIVISPKLIPFIHICHKQERTFKKIQNIHCTCNPYNRDTTFGHGPGLKTSYYQSYHFNKVMRSDECIRLLKSDHPLLTCVQILQLTRCCWVLLSWVTAISHNFMFRVLDILRDMCTILSEARTYRLIRTTTTGYTEVDSGLKTSDNQSYHFI